MLEWTTCHKSRARDFISYATWQIILNNNRAWHRSNIQPGKNNWNKYDSQLMGAAFETRE